MAPSVGCLSRPRGSVAAHRSCAAVAARQRVSPLFMADEEKQVDPEILAKVKEIVVSQLAVEESQVIPSASFTQDLGADSLDTVELIMALEEGFDVSAGGAWVAFVSPVYDIGVVCTLLFMISYHPRVELLL